MRGQQARMDVEQPVRPGLDEAGREQPHVAGERDQLDAVLAQRRVELGVELLAAQARHGSSPRS